MKLSITQIILGALIILAACYITGWMIFNAPDELRKPVTDTNGETTWIDVVPQHNLLFSIARYGSYVLPILGLFLVIGGTFQAARGGLKKQSLAAGYIAAGVLVTGLSFIITTWGYPTTFMPAEPGKSNLLMMFGNPGRTQIPAEFLSGATTLTGLAIVGTGIAQLVKSRKKATG